MKNKNIKITIDNISIKGSLGTLAYGDVAFEKWRKIKVENNLFNEKTMSVEQGDEKE